MLCYVYIMTTKSLQSWIRSKTTFKRGVKNLVYFIKPTLTLYRSPLLITQRPFFPTKRKAPLTQAARLKYQANPVVPPAVTHRSRRVCSAQLGTVRSNMQDGEFGDSRRARTYPAGNREHRHQLYRTDTPVSQSPLHGWGSSSVTQLAGAAASWLRLALIQRLPELAQNFNPSASIIGQLAG